MNTDPTRHILPVAGILLFTIVAQSSASWGTPDSSQYHIQTDEGPERYFRYLTDNGQYRKEKRLQDGTVIGTDAWIDASGFLRQKDYIADGEGYRILKSNTIYVGKGQSIQDAMTNLKKLSSSLATKKLKAFQTTSTTTPSIPYVFNYRTSTAAPLYFNHPSSTPTVYVRPNSQPVDKVQGISQTKLRIPSLTYEPPYIGYPSTTTYSPLHRDELRPIAEYPSSTPSPISSTQLPPISTSYIDPYPTQVSSLNTDILPPFVTATPITGDIDNHIHRFSSTTGRPLPITSTEASIVPISGNDLEQPIYSRPVNSRNPFLRVPYDDQIGNGYDPQYPQYDGVAVNANGFRYYLPKQYHEEENIDGNRKAGSFGYIDPFGIRRVIYYNASPEQGFVHRKNNRYVGHNATPYDPRPL